MASDPLRAKAEAIAADLFKKRMGGVGWSFQLFADDGKLLAVYSQDGLANRIHKHLLEMEERT